MVDFLAALPPSKTLGRYMLFEPPIASGGMASVYLARMLGSAGFARTVAIKRLQPAFATDPDFVSMFLDEARLAARIRHPNVVPTIDVVALEGELFLVMEYIHGESLSALLRLSREVETRPPLRIVAAILCNALDGLHAAHEARSERGEPLDLVHRDVSPQNILVGADGVARIIDLGVAKAASRIATTRDGQIKGKLGYMAPEQIRGSVSRASDIYSGGIVLWEAVTLRRAFEASNEGELLEKVLTAAVDAPSKFVPELPAVVDTIVQKALARNPANRYTTARAMARAIEAEIGGAPPAEVSDWVEKLARERLDERSRRIAAIEGPAAEADAAPTLPERATRRRPPRLATLLLGLVAAVSLVVAGVALRSKAQPVDAATVTPAASPEASTADPLPSTTPSMPDPQPVATVSATAPSTTSKPPSAPTRKMGRTPQRPNCDPPYVFDDSGIKHYKRECSP